MSVEGDVGEIGLGWVFNATHDCLFVVSGCQDCSDGDGGGGGGGVGEIGIGFLRYRSAWLSPVSGIISWR